MFFIPLLISAVLSTAASIYVSNKQTDAANDSAKAAAKQREDLLKRNQEDATNVLRENSKRRIVEKERRLAELKVMQAASGMANSGTQLAIFGQIESRIDDDINQATNQGLDQIANYRERISISKFTTENTIAQNNYTNSLNKVSAVVSGLSSVASAYKG